MPAAGNATSQSAAGWKLYGGAWVPTTLPHEAPNLDPLRSGSLWLGGGLFARWTEDFDCGAEMPFYYVIKDDVLDMSSMKSKRRYEINKGLRNFDVTAIEPCEMLDELFSVQEKAFSAYPAANRPIADRNSFPQEPIGQDSLWLGARGKDDGRLYGYANIEKRGKCADFLILKTDPAAERKAINAALVAEALFRMQGFIEGGGYVCDGSRNMRHQTNFQDYLEKYFGFRKAYCTLRMAYPRRIGAAVKLLYPFRRAVARLNGALPRNIAAVLAMEEICRVQGCAYGR